MDQPVFQASLTPLSDLQEAIFDRWSAAHSGSPSVQFEVSVRKHLCHLICRVERTIHQRWITKISFIKQSTGFLLPEVFVRTSSSIRYRTGQCAQ